jgi:hypothetical protein
VLAAAAIAIVALLLPHPVRRRLAPLAVAAAMVAGLAGPAAASIATAATTHGGAIPSASPTVSGSGPGGGAPGGGAGGAFGGAGNAGARAPGGAAGGTGGQSPTAGSNGARLGNQGAGAGGLLQGSTASAELTALLTNGADGFTWVAATVGSNSAAGYQLATQEPVMSIGGFNGSDPWPTLAAFQQYVSEGKIHYFIASGGGAGGGGAGSSTSSAIASWVSSNFTATTVGGVTVYDLTQGSAS